MDVWNYLRRKGRYSMIFRDVHDIPINFLLFESIKITENVWKNWGFVKADHGGLLCTPDLRCSFFELVSYSFRIKSIKYMNSGRSSWLWIPRHLALITHDATMSVNSSINFAETSFNTVPFQCVRSYFPEIRETSHYWRRNAPSSVLFWFQNETAIFF